MMYCFMFKWMISNALDEEEGKRFSRRLAGHIKRCESCRDFYESSVSLGRRLALQSADECQRFEGLPPEAEFGEGAAHQKAEMKGVKMRLLACAAGLICAGVIAVMLCSNGANKEEGVLSTNRELTPPVGEALDIYNSAAKRVMETQGAPYLAAVEDSLQSELLLARNDAESALRFLVGCVAVDTSGYSAGRPAD